MSLSPTTMPGVLMDESEDARALFIAAETPTRSQVIKSAQWLGVTVETLCASIELDFNSLPDDDDDADAPDIAPLRIVASTTEDQPALTTADRITYWMVVGICAAITMAALAGGLGYIWHRWFA